MRRGKLTKSRKRLLDQIDFFVEALYMRILLEWPVELFTGS